MRLTGSLAQMVIRHPVSISMVLLLLLATAIGPAVAPYSSTAFHPSNALQGPSLQFPLGTDQFGRDIFSRILYGTRLTLIPAIASAGLGVLMGSITGIVAGYKGGLLDEFIMRVMDALMSFPALILALLIIVMLGSNPLNVVGALAVVFWPRSARLVRGGTMDLQGREFIAAARARGEGTPYILFREITPNLWPLIIVDGSLRITYAILLSASLAYLGVGVTPPNPAWGLMIQDGQKYLQLDPWLVIAPSFAIGLAAVASVMFGQALRATLAMPRSLVDR